jgi:predicted acetyltransferase
VSALTFRRGKPSDIERLVEVHTSAFPDPRGFEDREHNFTRNRLGTLDDLRVVEQGGVIIAHAFLFALEIGFGGACVKSCGIATVGVAPEARGAGVAGALLDHLHADARARGDAVSVLFAFRQGFYARHGYGAATSKRRLVFSPHAVPRLWRPEGVRAARGDDRAAIAAVYARSLLRHTGWLARSERQWEELLVEEHLHWLVATRDDGGVAGYVAWSLTQAEAHAKTTMRVRELVADDDAAERALLAVVGAQRDQAHHVALDVAVDDPIDRALVDADRMRFGTDDAEHVLGEILGGPMVRILDTSRALAARGYPADGALRFVVDDTTTLALRVKDGRGHVDASSSAPTLRLASTTLAAILYGALRPSDASRLGLVETDDAHAIVDADRILALPPYFALDPF